MAFNPFYLLAGFVIPLMQSIANESTSETPTVSSTYEDLSTPSPSIAPFDPDRQAIHSSTTTAIKFIGDVDKQKQDNEVLSPAQTFGFGYGYPYGWYGSSYGYYGYPHLGYTGYGHYGYPGYDLYHGPVVHHYPFAFR